MSTEPEVERVLGKTNLILDATMLSALMSCPRMFDLGNERSFQLIGGKSNSLEVGSLVHKFLEVYYRNRINGFDVDKSCAAGLLAADLYVRGCPTCTDFKASVELDKPICGHTPNDYPGVRNTPADSDSRFVGWKDAINTCEQYHAFYRNDYWIPLEVEVVKQRILYEDDNIRVMWKAKFDWIADSNQGIYPIDHKTSKQRRDTLSINNQFMGQCLLMNTRGMIVNKVGFQKTLKPEEKFTRVLMSYAVDRLLEFQSEILPHYAYSYIAYAENGYYPPNFTHCETKYGNCKFVPVCEANPDMREEVIQMHYVVGNKWEPVSSEE